MWRSAKGGMDLNKEMVSYRNISAVAHRIYMTYTYMWYDRLALACCDIGSMFVSTLGALVKMVLWVLCIDSGPIVLCTYVYDITNDLYMCTVHVAR